MLSTVKITGVASLLTIFGLGTANAADPLVAPPAPAPNVNTMSLKISGQVNRAVLYGDNDDGDSEIFFVDNDNSGTRFRFVASGRLNDDVTAGATIELEFESNSTPDIRFDANGGTGGSESNNAAVGERIGEVWFNSASMGKLSLGQGNTASNGTSEVDLSGTDVVAYSGVADLGGGLGFGGNTGADAVAGSQLTGTNALTTTINGFAAADDIVVGDVFTNLDGGSRRDRIRYDTPTFAGFRASTSASTGGRWDVALRYAGQFAGAKVAAAIAYQDATSVDNSRGIDGGTRINGSVSVRLDNGLGLTFAAGENNNDAGFSDTRFYYGKLSFTTSSISTYGKTSFSVDYFNINNSGGDQRNFGIDGEAYSAAIVQNLDPIGAQLYAAVRMYNIDASAIQLNTNINGDQDVGAYDEDVLAIMVGSRIKF